MAVRNRQNDCNAIVKDHFTENSAAFRRLRELREQGWNNPEGDRHFERQRRIDDKSSEKTAEYFYDKMVKMAGELQRLARAFNIPKRDSDRPAILDFCAAPGGFLGKALKVNPDAAARVFSLPASSGGHRVLLPVSERAPVEFIDITLLATDMGVAEIPEGHPDAHLFLPRMFRSGESFDLVICDGQVLRTHDRSSHREKRENRRLVVTQLALGLEHVRVGGRMIILLHRLDVWDTVLLLYQFSRFSSIRLLKPQVARRTRSSFYLVASDIQAQHPEALQAIEAWKDIWRAATFVSDDDEYANVISSYNLPVDVVLEDFGQELVKKGDPIWRIQADALAEAPFITNG